MMMVRLSSSRAACFIVSLYRTGVVGAVLPKSWPHPRPEPAPHRLASARERRKASRLRIASPPRLAFFPHLSRKTELSPDSLGHQVDCRIIAAMLRPLGGQVDGFGRGHPAQGDQALGAGARGAVWGKWRREGIRRVGFFVCRRAKKRAHMQTNSPLCADHGEVENVCVRRRGER